MNKQNGSSSTQRILTFNEACRYLSVRPATLYAWLGEGRVPGFKVEGSRVWKFDIKDLDQWIEEQKENSKGAVING